MAKQVDSNPTDDVCQSTAMVDIGLKVREARTSLGMSVGEAANAAGVTRAYLWQIEAGDANPTIAALQRIVEAVGLEIIVRTRRG